MGLSRRAPIVVSSRLRNDRPCRGANPLTLQVVYAIFRNGLHQSAGARALVNRDFEEDAREGSRAALRSLDGSGRKSEALEAAVTSEYGLDFDAIVRLVYSDPADRQLLTRLARTVMTLDDDPVMAGILDAGCDYLVAVANVLRRQLGTGERRDELPVAMHGGVFLSPYVLGRFVSATGAQAAARAPEFGAVDLAIRHHRQQSDHGTARSF
jgi:N-acetylglucosamine kinase-like BadF-type ATPase